VGLTLSVGLTAGVFGMLAAHEMVHSRHAGERSFGLIMLAGVLYMQFAIAHLVGHHRHAATREDPASARRGESVYAFVVRSIGGQTREAWDYEAARLRRAGKSALDPSNRLLRFAAVEALVVIVIGLFGFRALIFFLAQAALAIVLLELFNYIAHYGLTRRRGHDGRLERLGPHHSWNSARRMNNWSLFNMGRHSDHHRFSARPYHQLEAVAGAAFLPSGYAGAILLALVPPLWRRVMDARVDRVMALPPDHADGRLPSPRPQARLTQRPVLLRFPADPRGRDRVSVLGAEGATAPETLRQKDRGV
jgi:alkane 1-monooxygenase